MYKFGQNQVANNYQERIEADKQGKDSVYQDNRMAVERDNDDRDYNYQLESYDE